MTGKAAVAGRGRKPKPNNKKLLSGSKHAISDAIEFETISNVDAPEWLDDLATQMWQTVCPPLCKEKILAVTDLHNLEIFCSAYSTFRLSALEVARDGISIETPTGCIVKNPALTAKNEAARQMATFGGALGLDPAARGRLMGPSGGKKGNAFGDF
jgi:P27 family predicted phage terminase small subunit